MPTIDTLNDRRNAFAASIRHVTIILNDTNNGTEHFFYTMLRDILQTELDKADKAIYLNNANN